MCERWRREEGHAGGDSGHGVGNGLDRGCVDVVDDDRGLFPSLLQYP